MLAVLILLGCIAAPIIAAALGFALHERLFARDVSQHRCTGCGYNLRDLSTGTLCPECGRDEAAQRGAGSSRHKLPSLVAIAAGTAMVGVSVPLLNSYATHARSWFSFSLAVPFVVLAVVLILPRYGRHRSNAWTVLAVTGGCLGLAAANTIHNRATTSFVGEYGRDADLQFAALGMLFLGTGLVGAVATAALGMLWAIDRLRQRKPHALTDDRR